MIDFKKLIEKANHNQCRLLIRFDPDEHKEEWGIKYYPDPDSSAHFYAYNEDLNAASRQLLDDLQGFQQW